MLEIEELCRDVSSEVVEGALKLENPEPLLDLFFRPVLDGERDTLSAGSSVCATAFAISVMAAGSFSGGECCHLSNGLSSSQGLSAAAGAGIEIAGVVGFRLGDEHSLGRAFSVTVHELKSVISET